MDKPNKPTPVGVCTVCGAYTFNGNLIQKNCHKKYDGKRCQGHFGSAVCNNDWAP